MKNYIKVDESAYDGRHEKFQFGDNPSKMSEYEKQMTLQEQRERALIKEKYSLGIQGVDGGCRYDY